MPERIQRRRTAGWRMPPGVKYVGRPTRWGNPFAVGMVVDRVALTRHGIHTHAEIRIASRRHAEDCYRRWFDGIPMLIGEHKLAPPPPTAAEIRAALAGHDLACWCPPGPCHANLLLEIANAAAVL